MATNPAQHNTPSAQNGQTMTSNRTYLAHSMCWHEIIWFSFIQYFLVFNLFTKRLVNNNYCFKNFYKKLDKNKIIILFGPFDVEEEEDGGGP